ncbi:MAG: hypothetical protein ACLU38_08295 [Dysosmobacter sp.]
MLYLELFAAKRRQKPPFFLQSSQFTFELPLNSKSMDIPFRFASLRGIIAAKEAAIGSLLFHPAKPEDRAAEVP